MIPSRHRRKVKKFWYAAERSTNPKYRYRCKRQCEFCKNHERGQA